MEVFIVCLTDTYKIGDTYMHGKPILGVYSDIEKAKKKIDKDIERLKSISQSNEVEVNYCYCEQEYEWFYDYALASYIDHDNNSHVIEYEIDKFILDD